MLLEAARGWRLGAEAAVLAAAGAAGAPAFSTALMAMLCKEVRRQGGVLWRTGRRLSTANGRGKKTGRGGQRYPAPSVVPRPTRSPRQPAAHKAQFDAQRTAQPARAWVFLDPRTRRRGKGGGRRGSQIIAAAFHFLNFCAGKDFWPNLVQISNGVAQCPTFFRGKSGAARQICQCPRMMIRFPLAAWGISGHAEADAPQRADAPKTTSPPACPAAALVPARPHRRRRRRRRRHVRLERQPLCTGAQGPGCRSSGAPARARRWNGSRCGQAARGHGGPQRGKAGLQQRTTMRQRAGGRCARERVSDRRRLKEGKERKGKEKKDPSRFVQFFCLFSPRPSAFLPRTLSGQLRSADCLRASTSVSSCGGSGGSGGGGLALESGDCVALPFSLQAFSFLSLSFSFPFFPCCALAVPFVALCRSPLTPAARCAAARPPLRVRAAAALDSPPHRGPPLSLSLLVYPKDDSDNPFADPSVQQAQQPVPEYNPFDQPKVRLRPALLTARRRLARAPLIWQSRRSAEPWKGRPRDCLVWRGRVWKAAAGGCCRGARTSTRRRE